MNYSLTLTVRLPFPSSDRQAFYDRLAKIGLKKSARVDTTWDGVTQDATNKRAALQRVEMQVRFAAIMAQVDIDYHLSSDCAPVEGSYQAISTALLAAMVGPGLLKSKWAPLLRARRSQPMSDRARTAFAMLGNA